MSCNTCGQTNKCNHVDFALDGTYLVPSVGGVPGDGVDLANAIGDGEAETRLQLDAGTNSLKYYSERSVNNGEEPDTIPLNILAENVSISDLADVASSVLSTGDVLIYDAEASSWISYTIPIGDIVSNVGINLEGKLVKSNSGGGGGGGDAGVPIGAGYTWNGPPSTFPAGMVPKDGRELSRVVYAELYAILGTTYGNGNGTTTFNIPNTKDRTSVNLGATTDFNALGKAPGASRVAITSNEMPPHRHTGNTAGAGYHGHNVSQAGSILMTAPGGTNNRVAVGGGGQQVQWGGIGIDANGNHGHAFTSDLAGGGASHNNIQLSFTEYHLMRII